MKAIKMAIWSVKPLAVWSVKPLAHTLTDEIAELTHEVRQPHPEF
jgi:hypothetical protein